MAEEGADAVDSAREAGCVVGVAGEGEVGGVEVVRVFMVGGGRGGGGGGG